MSERSAQRTGKRKAREHDANPRDPSGKWKERVTQLEKTLGWPRGALWHYYDQLALLAEFELKVSRTISEHVAMRLLKGCFDKAGAEVH